MMGIIEIFEKLSKSTTEEYPDLYEAIFKLVSDKTDLEILPLKFVVEFSKKVICDLSIENDKIREFALYILGLFLTLKKSEQVFSSSEKNEIALKIITLMKGVSNNVSCKAFWCFNQLTHIYNLDSEMAYEVLACIESVDPNSNDRFMIYYEACFLLQRLIKQNKDEMIKYAKRVAKLVFIPLSHPVSKIRETSYVTLNLFLPSMLNSQKEVSIGLVQIVSGTYIKDLLHLYALKKERFVLNIWKILVKLLGNSLHKGCLIINKLLDVPELGFKHASPEIKLETYTVWRALIDNFALDLHVLCNTKRLSLLLQPLQKSTDFSESIVSAKCITWWHILWCLKDRLSNHFEQVGIPLLEYALGISLTERSELQSVSNGLRPRFLKIKGCELLMRVLERPNNVPFLVSRKKSRASFPALKVPLQITTVIRLFKVFVKASRLVLEEFGNDPKLWGHIDYLLKSFVIIIFMIPEESSKDTISSASSFFQLTWDIVQGQLCPPIICLKLIERLSQFPCRMLTAHYYHVGNTEVMHGNLATSLLTMLIHPALLAVPDFNTRLTTIFCRLAKTAIQGSLAPLGYAQHVTKLIKNPTVLKNFQGEMLLNMWTDVVTALLQTLQKSQEVSRSSSIDTDFTYMNIILAYPIECCFALNVTPMRTKCALNLWTDLYKYFYQWASLVPTLDANVASQGLCAEIRKHLKSENLKNSRFFNSLCQLVQVIVEQMDFDLLNNANNEGGNFEMCKWLLKRKEPLKSITSVVDIIVLLLDFFVDEIIHEEVYKLDDLNEAQKMESAKMSLTVLDILITFFSSITSSAIVLSAISRFAKPLSRLFMFQYRKNFNTKMHLHAFPNKVISLWKTIARCIQLHYKGPYDSDFLTIMSPLLESTLLHCRQAIRDSSRKFWLASFSYKQFSLNYPCSLKNVLLKVKPSLVSGLETSPTAEISPVPSSIELQECFRVSPVNTHNFKLLSSDNAKPDDPVCKSVNLNIRKKGDSKAIARNLNFSIDELPDEAFTKVASVPKSVVFTSHQMERRKRRSYVPALYNDLSQNSCATDSLSDMQDNTCTTDSMNIVEVTSPCGQLNKKLKVSVWPQKRGNKHEDKIPSSGSDMTVFPGRKSLNKEVEENSNKNERGTVVQKDLENNSESRDGSMEAIEELESVTISESENDLGRKQDSILNSTVTNISRDSKIIDYEKESVKENIDTNVLEFHSNEATHTEELKNLQQTYGKTKEHSGLQVNEDIAVAADSIEKEENVMKKNKNISNSCSAVGENKSSPILNTIYQMSTSFTESLLNVDFTQLKKNNGQELNVTESTVLLNDSEGIIPSSQTNTENSVSGVKKRGRKRKRGRKPAAAKCIIEDSFDKEHVIKVAGVKKRGRPPKCIIKDSFDKEHVIKVTGVKKRGRPAKCIIKDSFDKEHVIKVAGVQSNNHCSNSVVSSIKGVDTLSLPMEVKESSNAKTVASLKNLASIVIARGEKDATKLSQTEEMIASSSLESLDVLGKTEKDHPGLPFGTTKHIKNCEQQDLITGDAGSNIELHVCSTSKQKNENHCENNKFLESLQFKAINENSAKEHPHNNSKELVKSEEISSTEVICKYGKTKILQSVPRKSERVCRRKLGNRCCLVTHNHGQTRMQLSKKMSVDPLGSVMNSHEKKKNCEGKSTSEPPSCDFVVSSPRELCVSLPKMAISEYKIQINLPQNSSPFPHNVVTKPKEKLCNTSECESPDKLRTRINCESLDVNNEKIAPADLLKNDKKIADSSDLLTFEKQLNLPIQKVGFVSKSNELFSKTNEEEIDTNKPDCLDCGTGNDGSFKTVCNVDCLSSSNRTLKSSTTEGSTVTVIHLANSNVEHLETLSHNKDSNIEENKDKTSVNDLDCVSTDDSEHLKENYVVDSDSLDDHVVVRSIESVSSTSGETPSCDATLQSDQENTVLSLEIEHVDATETSLELSAKEAPGPKSIDILCDVKEDSKTIDHDHTFENIQAEIGKTQISSEMGKSATENHIGKNETVIVLPYRNFKPDILSTTNKGEISVSTTVSDTSVESRTVTTNLEKSNNFNLPTDLSEKNCEYGKTDYPKFCSSESDSYTTKLNDIVMSVNNDVETVSLFISKEKEIQPSLGNLPLAKSSTNLEGFIRSENNDEGDGSSSTCEKSETLSSFGNDLVDSDVSHLKSGIGKESCTIELPLQVTPSTNHGSQIICCNTNGNKATHSNPEDQDVDTAKLQNIATRGAKRRKFRSPSKISLSLVKTTKNSFRINESVSKRSKNMLPKQNLAEKKSNFSHKKSCKKQNKSKRHSHLFPLENCSLQDTAGTQQLSEMYEILLKSLDSSCENSNKFLKSINSYLKLQELKPSESQKLFQSSKLCVKKLKCLMKNLKHSNSVKNFASESSSNIKHKPKGLSCEDIDDSMLVNENLSCTSDAMNIYNMNEADCHVINAGLLPSTSSHGNNSDLHFSLSSDADAKNNKENVIVSKNETCTSPHAAKKVQTDYFSSPLSRSQKMVQAARKMVSPEIQSFNPLCSSSIPKTGTARIISSSSASLFPINTSFQNSSSPSGSILKRKHCDSSSTQSTPSKKRRVSFAEPVVSGEMLIESKNNSPRQRTAKRRLQLNEAHVHKGRKRSFCFCPEGKEPSTYNNRILFHNNSLQKVASDAAKPYGDETSVEKTVNFMDAGLPNSTLLPDEFLNLPPPEDLYPDSASLEFDICRPIFEPLANCKDPVDLLIPRLTSPMWTRGVTKMLLSQNVKTIGDLSTLSIPALERLPFKSPKLETIVLALKDYMTQSQRKSLDDSDKSSSVNDFSDAPAGNTEHNINQVLHKDYSSENEKNIPPSKMSNAVCQTEFDDIVEKEKVINAACQTEFDDIVEKGKAQNEACQTDDVNIVENGKVQNNDACQIEFDDIVGKVQDKACQTEFDDDIKNEEGQTNGGKNKGTYLVQEILQYDTLQAVPQAMLGELILKLGNVIIDKTKQVNKST